jgi:hypothetical protein
MKGNDPGEHKSIFSVVTPNIELYAFIILNLEGASDL